MSDEIPQKKIRDESALIDLNDCGHGARSLTVIVLYIVDRRFSMDIHNILNL